MIKSGPGAFYAVGVSLLSVVLAVPANAATLTVPGDHATIQEAVDAAGNGDVIQVKGKHSGAILIDGKGDLTIRGSRGAKLDFGETANPLQLVDSGVVVIEGLSVRGGTATTLLVMTSAGFRVENCKFSKSTSSIAVGVRGTPNAIVRGCTFKKAVLPISYGSLVIGDSTGAVIENNKIIKATAGGVAAQTNGAIVRNNTFVKCLGTSIDISTFASADRSSMNTVSGNTVKKPALIGIRVFGSDHTIENNKVTGANLAAIFVVGDGHTTRGNTVKKTTQEGMVFDGDGHLVENNSVTKAGDDAIAARGTNSTYRNNNIKAPKDDGLEVPITGTGNTFEGNTILKAKSNGVELQGSNNTFTNNKATKSKEQDLFLDGATGSTFNGNTFPKNNAGL